jgi:hypothetical protein
VTITVIDAAGITWNLVDKDGKPVGKPHTANDFRGKQHLITGGYPPRHPGSTGHVWTGDRHEYYPSVFNLKWVQAP